MCWRRSHFRPHETSLVHRGRRPFSASPVNYRRTERVLVFAVLSRNRIVPVDPNSLGGPDPHKLKIGSRAGLPGSAAINRVYALAGGSGRSPPSPTRPAPWPAFLPVKYGHWDGVSGNFLFGFWFSLPWINKQIGSVTEREKYLKKQKSDYDNNMQLMGCQDITRNWRGVTGPGFVACCQALSSFFVVGISLPLVNFFSLNELDTSTLTIKKNSLIHLKAKKQVSAKITENNQSGLAHPPKMHFLHAFIFNFNNGSE